MERRPSVSRRRWTRHLTGLAGAVAVLALVAPSADAWGPREPAPVLNSHISQPGSSMTLREDGSAIYLARGLDAGSDVTTQLVTRPLGGPATFASPFPAAFGQYASVHNLFLSRPDAAGNVLVVREPATAGTVFLAPGANPAAAVVQPTTQISHVDLAPTGEAAAIVGGGSTASVSFREAGSAGTFDTPRELDRAGNDRSYGIGVTVDPDGGVFVVYRTEQSEAVLQAYAPPGEDFGEPEAIDVPAGAIGTESPVYEQSTNGHGILVWGEDVQGNSNPDEVRAATREPGELLGEPELVRAASATDRLVDPTAAGITDDGSAYVGVLDAKPVSGCPGNADVDRGGVIAVRAGAAGTWSSTPGQGVWPNTSEISRIATAGNVVGVVSRLSFDTGAKCVSGSPSNTALTVRMGQSGAVGSPSTVASATGGSVSAAGFAVNSLGRAILLSDEPAGGEARQRYIYTHPTPTSGGPGPGSGSGKPVVVPPPARLPAPGKIKLSGKKLTARGGDIPIEASCAKLGPGDAIFCRIDALLIEQTKSDSKTIDRGKISAKAPKTLGRAKRVKVAAGKRKKLTLKINKLGAKRLKKKAKRGVAMTLRVTIRKGANVAKIERKVTVKAKAKKRKRKRN